MTPAESQLNHLIARQLLNARLARGVSQTEVAAIVGLSYQSVQKYESGGTVIPAARLALLADFFGLDIGYFFQKGNHRQRDAQGVRYRRMLMMRKLQAIEQRDPDKFRAICDMIGPIINSPDL